MMKTAFLKKSLILLLTVIFGSVAFIGCDEMEEENHNTDPGRTGVDGYSLMLSITPSRAPSNNDATMNVHIRFFKMADMSPVANTRVRVMIDSPYGYELDPEIVSFANDVLLTDVVTNSAGEADVTLFVGYLDRSEPEVIYEIDIQSTVEYEVNNHVEVWASELFYIYNPFWDGTRPPDTTLPTAIITYFPSTGITPGTKITFMGANSYDRGDSDLTFGRAYDEIVAYNWNFADGSYGSGKTVTHLYAGVGTYNVELMVVDDEGQTGQSTVSVVVAEYTPTPTP
ncbi:PKD domain-containing protein [bacterium]|nr:PKD domain-containing protein [candidate division CSSED10-310 bacterium]